MIRIVAQKKLICQHPKMAVNHIDDVIRVEMQSEVNVVCRNRNDVRWVVTCQSNY